MADMEDVHDVSSLSNIAYFKANHLSWQIDVCFKSNTLKSQATQHYECILPPPCPTLLLDTKNLTIDSVHIGNEKVEHKLLSEITDLGQALEISLPPKCCTVGALFTVMISYHTSPKASATQWLPPDQTLGKKYPYMYTQCQKIHARSILPCQDSPGCKFTYDAEVTVPKDMVALMSAIKGEDRILEGERKECHFKQETPISSYLLALAVGFLEWRTIGPRSKVWSERENIEACEYEFALVEEVLTTAESLLGPYIWQIYDILVLPPSFPLAGMENPCLTFLTPTIITGDRALTSTVIHEITHSWTGNLVTNKKWCDFWLNEGLTRFIEGKLNGILYGEQMRQLMAVQGWGRLIDSINDFGAQHNYTALVPKLTNINPSAAFSAVPYDKGAAFLYYLETLVGGADIFNKFLRDYISKFKYKSIQSKDFKHYFIDYFSESKVSEDIDWDTWLYSPGMPPVNLLEMYDMTLANSCNVLSEKWLTNSVDEMSLLDTGEFSSLTTRQKIYFLSQLSLEKPLGVAKVSKMAEMYNLFLSTVGSIKFYFFRLCINSKWLESYPHIVKFLQEQGRSRFTKVLYKEMYEFDESRELAVKTFRENCHLYHPIVVCKVAKDLKLEEDL